MCAGQETCRAVGTRAVARNAADEVIERTTATGKVMAAQANFVRVKVESVDGPAALDEPPRARLLCVVRGLLKKIKQTVLVGDTVRVVGIDWVDGRGMVEEVLPRKSELSDPAVANVDHVVLVFAADMPPFQPVQVTRYLVSSEAAGMPVTLLVNKSDLVSPEQMSSLVEQVASWGYTALPVSVVSGVGLDSLAERLRDKVAVVAGPSGAGKSSVINALRLRSAGLEGSLEAMNAEPTRVGSGTPGGDGEANDSETSCPSSSCDGGTSSGGGGQQAAPGAGAAVLDASMPFEQGVLGAAGAGCEEVSVSRQAAVQGLGFGLGPAAAISASSQQSKCAGSSVACASTEEEARGSSEMWSDHPGVQSGGGAGGDTGSSSSGSVRSFAEEGARNGVLRDEQPCSSAGGEGVSSGTPLSAAHILEELELQAVGDVSQRIGRGKHTTRNVTLLELGGGGLLADTPGFSQPVIDMPVAQLWEAFPEIRARLEEERCAFSNCQHLEEPGCAVRGDWERYTYYCDLHAELSQQEEIQRERAASKRKREGNVRFKSRAGGKQGAEARLETKSHRRVSRRSMRQELSELSKGQLQDED